MNVFIQTELRDVGVTLSVEAWIWSYKTDARRKQITLGTERQSWSASPVVFCQSKMLLCDFRHRLPVVFSLRRNLTVQLKWRYRMMPARGFITFIPVNRFSSCGCHQSEQCVEANLSLLSLYNEATVHIHQPLSRVVLYNVSRLWTCHLLFLFRMLYFNDLSNQRYEDHKKQSVIMWPLKVILQPLLQTVNCCDIMQAVIVTCCLLRSSKVLCSTVALSNRW